MTWTGRRDHRRRGSAYIAVLGFATLMLVAALAALMTARVERTSIGLANDRAQARALALSAVDRALYTIATATTTPEAWRTRLNQLAAEQPARLGAGTLEVELFDAVDGDPTDVGDPVTVIGIGVAGDATYRLSVGLDESGERIEGSWARWTP
ncbi:MAG: hypothetical protein AAF138_02260 [Planctomycetota bacterium]